MKLNYRNIAGVVLLIALSASATYAQQQFTHTVTRLNKDCNATCTVLDVPELNNNPSAIILVTPVVAKGMNLNPHPIGAYYMYLKKWSILNLDQTTIVEGAKFNVQYFLNPGPDRFVYIVPPRARESEAPCIDHAGLNDNPNAQIRFFPTGSPTHGAFYNKHDIKVEYDATVLKWCMANINNKPLYPNTAYNVVITSAGAVIANPSMPVATPNVQIVGTTTPSAPIAPLTVVVREVFTVVDQWGITPESCHVKYYNNPSVLITDTVIVTVQRFPGGDGLWWTAAVGSNGSIAITVCRGPGSSVIHLSNRKVNILVLR